MHFVLQIVKNYKLRPGYMIVEAKDFEYGKLFKAQLLNSGAPPSPTELDVKQCKKLWLKVPAGGGIWWHDIKDEDEETSNLSTSGIARVKKEFVVMCLK